MGALDARVPGELDVQVILDNGSSHVALATRWWFHKHQRLHPHYTPSHASWLNQAELFVSILTRRLLKRGEFAWVTELVDRIMAFIADYNHTARPFRWTYDGRPLQAAWACPPSLCGLHEHAASIT